MTVAGRIGESGLAGSPMSLYPGRDLLARAAEARALGKEPVSIKSYRVEVFDMHSADDRGRYARTMSEIFPRVVSGECVVWKNELQTMTRPDGSTGWMRYLEWADYEVPGEASLEIGR